MRNPLILNGSEIVRSTFGGTSPFYDGYHYQTAKAELRDVSYAIGCARSAARPSLKTRIENLKRAAAAFSYTQEHLEHTVRMTGMPIKLVEEFYRQIPELLQAVGRGATGRFGRTGRSDAHLFEILDEGKIKLLFGQEGFCYAITPGNDPRAAALVAANLAYLGIPFVLRASPRDAAPPAVIRALVEGGFEPEFTSLVYLEPGAADTPQKHFKLVEASSAVWTFGAAEAIDPVLRYEVTGERAVLDLKGLPESTDISSLIQKLENEGLEELLKRLELETERVDHFRGKTILRHSAGNCAGVAWGGLDEAAASLLFRSFAFPAVCSAMKTVMIVEEAGWMEQAADFISGLVVGDPLEAATQVGYVSSRTLDRVEQLKDANSCQISSWGGRRISPQQAEPLLVSSRNETPDFFGQDIPAYVLAARPCDSTDEAIECLNRSAQAARLAVALINAPASERLPALLKLKAHSVLLDHPTTAFTPLLHEGNDYLLTLSQARLLMY